MVESARTVVSLNGSYSFLPESKLGCDRKDATARDEMPTLNEAEEAILPLGLGHVVGAACSAVPVTVYVHWAGREEGFAGVIAASGESCDSDMANRRLLRRFALSSNDRTWPVADLLSVLLRTVGD